MAYAVNPTSTNKNEANNTMKTTGQYGDAPLSPNAVLQSDTTLTISRVSDSNDLFQVNQRRVEQSAVGADSTNQKSS